MIRGSLVWLHRWFGLAMALFLIIEGMTGSLLAFNSSLTRLLNPKLFAAKPSRDAQPLDLASLAEAAEAVDSRFRVAYFAGFEEERVLLRCAGRKNLETGIESDLGFMYLVLDPYTGRELGRLRWLGYDVDGGVVENFIPFIFDLHTTLAGIPAGSWLLSVVALIWSIDCFIGFYLTFPATRHKFWRRWKISWQLNWRGGVFRALFDLHRAGGLWFWVPLFVFAWSSVQLTGRFGIYDAVMNTVFRSSSEGAWFGDFFPNHPVENPRLKWRAAQEAGERHMAEYARRDGFRVIRPLGLNYFEGSGLYNYIVETDRHFPNDREAIVFLDADTGEFHGTIGTSHPSFRVTVDNWLFALHNVKDPVRNIPYRVLVAATGVMIVILSVTGIYIWWKKRASRLASRMNSRRRVEQSTAPAESNQTAAASPEAHSI